jgi:hypothetical protein
MRINLVALLLAFGLSSCGNPINTKQSKGNVHQSAIKFDVAPEYKNIEGVNLFSKDITGHFLQMVKSEYDTKEKYAKIVDSENKYFSNKLIKSEIIASNLYLRYNSENNNFIYESNTSLLGKLAYDLVAINAPAPSSYTYWPVGEQSAGIGEIDGGNGVFLASPKCDFSFPYPNEVAENFKLQGKLKFVVTYRLKSSFSKNFKHHLNVSANYLTYELNSPEEWSVFHPFMIAKIENIYVIDASNGKIMHKTRCL